jgi:hypothetical protein
MNELITRSLQLRKLERVLTFPEPLMNDFEKEIVLWIKQYAFRYNKMPSLSRFKRQFSSFAAIASHDPLEDILDECIRRKKQILAQAFVNKINITIQEGEDPTQVFAEANSVLGATSGSMLSYSSFDRRIYFEKKKYLKFGIGIVDRVTGGLGTGELAYIAGRLGSFKTTLVEHVAFKWWLMGYRVLYVSNEALPMTVFAHLDAIAGKFNPSSLRQENVPQDIKRKILRVMSAISRNKKNNSKKKRKLGEIIVSSERLITPSQVFALASYLNVDAVIIDGVYLMRPDNATSFSQNWENMTLVSRALKQGALSLHTRVLGILQKKRSSDPDKQTTEDIAYADAFPQDADIVLSVVAENNLLTTEVIKNREGMRDVGTVIEIDQTTRSFKDLQINTHEIQEIELGDHAQKTRNSAHRNRSRSTGTRNNRK